MGMVSSGASRSRPKNYWKVLILVLAIFASGRPASGLSLEVKQAQINQWYDIATPAGPVDWPAMPKMLRSKVRKAEPFVSIYRFQLQKGRKYTFQTEYPADYLTGSACLRGVNPLADSDHYNAPSGTTAMILCKHRGFPGGNIKGYVFGRKSNFTVSSKSQHDSAYLVISSKKPNTPFRFRMIDPADDDDFILKKGGYQLRPGRDPYYSWSNVYKKHFWLGYARGEEKKAQSAGKTADSNPASATAAANLNGQWELLDQQGKPYVWLTLTQAGDRISGRARYKKGTAALAGSIAGERLKLAIIYDNPEVLEQWLPAKVCSQAVGISSEVDLDLKSDPSAYQGTFNGFWVRWDSSQNITQKYKGGSPEALEVAKSGPRVLRRIKAPVSSEDGETDQPAAGDAISAGPAIWIEAENDKAHRVATSASARHSSYPHSGTAYWYLATGSDWVEYDVTISQPGTYYIWIRDFDDQKHDPALRSVIVSVDGRRLATVPAHTRQGKSLWAWSRAGTGHLDPGRHTVKIAKERTTSAAALIDVIYITADGAALPPAVKEPLADRSKPMASATTTDCREQAKAFLEAVRSENYQQARAAMTDEFQTLAGNQELARFRRSLLDFGQYRYVADTCTRESGDMSEAILVLQNHRRQTVMVQFAFIDDRIDQCVARWGVQ